MTKEYHEVTGTIDVPKTTGVAGLLLVVEEIIKLPRVQDVRIDGRRTPVKVSFMRYAKEGEPDRPLNVDLETLEPYAVLRNGEINEVQAASRVAPVVMAQLFHAVSAAGLWPVAFVGGTKSFFWPWHDETGSRPSISSEDAYGLPFLSDKRVTDDVLLIAAAYTRAAALIDAHCAFKIVIPWKPLALPPTTVEVMQ